MVIGGPKPRRRMHPFIHIHVLHIDVPVDMYDADITIYVRGYPPNIWIT
jgi:hypothetical protein